MCAFCKTFTPLVMSAPGGMGRESQKFYARLSDMIFEERQKQLYVYDKIRKKKFCISKFSLYMFTW